MNVEEEKKEESHVPPNSLANSPVKESEHSKQDSKISEEDEVAEKEESLEDADDEPAAVEAHNDSSEEV